MLWIVQEDVHAKNQHYDLFQSLKRLDILYAKVKVNHNKIEPDIAIDNSQPIITNGSIMLSNIGKTKGWIPWSLFNDNFSYKVWEKEYGDLLISELPRHK